MSAENKELPHNSKADAAPAALAEAIAHEMPDPRTTIVSNPSSASKPRGPKLAKPTTPWKQASILEFPAEARAKYVGHGLRWVRIGPQGDRARIDEMMGEDGEDGRPLGWQLAERPKGPRKARSGGDVNVDGSDLASCWVRRGCVLMVLAPDRAAARRYYQAEEVAKQNGSIDARHEERFARHGAVATGSSNIR